MYNISRLEHGSVPARPIICSLKLADNLSVPAREPSFNLHSVFSRFLLHLCFFYGIYCSYNLYNLVILDIP